MATVPAMPSTDPIKPDRESTDVVAARIAAQVVDLVLMFVQVVAVGMVLAVLTNPDRAETLRGFVGVGFLTLPLYGGLFEAYWNGQTPGKRLLDVKVVGSMGHDPSVGQAFLRNLPAVIMFSWLTSAVALASMAMTDRRQRVFDTVADTYVVGTRPARRGAGTGSPATGSSRSSRSRSGSRR